jgi:NAD(P)-dependent dehydrogenase (short-subunit alcohol dehydrogenase family)
MEGKVAVVTGGGSGINLAIAQRYAEHGAKVGLIGRTQEKLDNAAEGIAAKGGIAAGFAADVRNYDVLAAAIAATREKFGEIDIVVCGAAGNFPAPALGMSANAFKSVIDIDLLGTFNTCRAAFEHLKRPGASIVNISATQAFVPMALQSHVCAAKAGVDMLTRTLALEWGPQGV